MDTTAGHLIRTEYVDNRRRHWCAVCRLPHTNERAQREHALALARIASDSTWRRYEPERD